MSVFCRIVALIVFDSTSYYTISVDTLADLAAVDLENAEVARLFFAINNEDCLFI